MPGGDVMPSNRTCEPGDQTAVPYVRMNAKLRGWADEHLRTDQIILDFAQNEVNAVRR